MPLPGSAISKAFQHCSQVEWCAIGLRACYAMSGTEIAYGATRSRTWTSATTSMPRNQMQKAKKKMQKAKKAQCDLCQSCLDLALISPLTAARFQRAFRYTLYQEGGCVD
eukprot:2554302-Rhodomonas_salina.1